MPSIISPKNVGRLMIVDAVATETTNSTFNSTASIGEAAVVKSNGAALAAKQPFKIVYKQDTSLTGVKISDVVDPNMIDYVKVSGFVAEQAKIVTVDGFTGTPIANATYRVSLKVFDGIQSPENFRHIHAFYVTDGNAVTYTTIQNALVASLNTSLEKESVNPKIVASVSGTTIVLTGQVQGFILGKDQGEPVYFDVEVSVKDNSPATLADSGTSYSILTVATTQNINSGVGTGKQVALAEYSLKGYENADYGREMGYPNNFNVTYLADPSAEYNTLVLGFHSTREATNVERQHKELTIVSTNIAVINAIKASIATAAPNITVPADLV